MMQYQIPDISSWLKKYPGHEDIESLLDLLPKAIMIIDARQNRIILSNSKTTELTAYTRQELRQLKAHSLLPNFSKLGHLQSLENLTQWETVLIQRSGIPIVVEITIEKLGSSDQWYAISLERNTTIQQKEVEKELTSQRWEALQSLSNVPRNRNLTQAYQQILQAGQLLTSASTAALYLPNPDLKLLELKHSWGNSEFLPAQLPSKELDLLRFPCLWEIGKRCISNIHKAALASKKRYLATTPIEENSPNEGLLILADDTTCPPTHDILAQIQILANAIFTTKSIFEHTAKLEKQIAKLNHILSINETIINIVNDGIIFITPHFTVLEMNATAEATLGYDSSEVSGQPICDLLVGANRLTSSLNSIIDNSEHLIDIGEIRFHRRDGQSVLAHLRAIPITFGQETEQIVLFISDLSHHEEFQNRAKQLEQQALLGEVTAIFAHEVRNPINNISTGLQLMAIEFPVEDPIQNQIDRLKQDCDRLAELMKSVLSFSKSREYKFEAVDLRGLIENILERWRPRLNRNNIQYRIQIPEHLLKINGDKRALEQVFINLISNASLAMKNQSNGVLAVKAFVEKDADILNSVNVDITDNGPGIPVEIRDRIFEPFFTTNKDGTGLGLAITKRIVTAHRGQITVESFPGGTVFHIKLPTVET
ncbi:ATP-binding protein [Chloroflexota bacterium]